MEDVTTQSSTGPTILTLSSILVFFIVTLILVTGQPTSIEVELPEFNFKIETYSIRSINISRPAFNYTLLLNRTTETVAKPPKPSLLEEILKLLLELLKRINDMISSLISRFTLKPVTLPEIREEAENPPQLRVNWVILLIPILGLFLYLAIHFYTKRRSYTYKYHKTLHYEARVGGEASKVESETFRLDFSTLKEAGRPQDIILEAFKIIYILALNKLSARESYTHREVARTYEEAGLGNEAKIIARAFEEVKFRKTLPKSISLREVLDSVLKIVKRLT